MKLIVFSQHFWPENFRINSIVNYLSKKNVIKRLSVFTAKPNYPKGKILKGYKKFSFEKKKKNQITIYRTQIIPRNEAKTINLILNYISYVISGLINLVKIKNNYDIVFVYCTSPIFQAIPAIIFSKMRKIPVVLWVQDLWPDSVQETGYIKNKFIIGIIKFITKIIYNNSDLILVQSRQFVKPIKELTKTNIKIFLNPSEFNFVKKNKFINKIKKNKRIYYAGNIGSVQNLNNLIQFCRNTKLKNFKIVLFGEGSKKKWLVNQIKNFNISDIIEVKKYLKKNKFKTEMNKADCFLLLLSDGKALSRTIPAKFQTYLYFGKPIISWSNGEVSLITKKKKLGFCAKSNSLKEFSSCISKLTKMKKKEFHKFNKNNIDYFNKNFSLEKNTENLIKIFKDQLTKKL
jgi:glycosyltransferase involved in cell wall biosynthesis